MHLRCEQLPLSVLMRGAEPCMKWAEDGSITQSKLSDSGGSDDLHALFASAETLTSAVGTCRVDGHIEGTGSTNDQDVVLRATDMLSSSPVDSAYVLDALHFIAHVFPLDEALEKG